MRKEKLYHFLRNDCLPTWRPSNFIHIGKISSYFPVHLTLIIQECLLLSPVNSSICFPRPPTILILTWPLPEDWEAIVNSPWLLICHLSCLRTKQLKSPLLCVLLFSMCSSSFQASPEGSPHVLLLHQAFLKYSEFPFLSQLLAKDVLL